MSIRKRGVGRENIKESAENQEVDVPSDKGDISTSATVREMRRREREHKIKKKEMTEEEMMALALRLSEQEANITAQRLKEEEEAVNKALQDSIFAESKSLIDADSPGVPRRKLVYSNGESQTVPECSTTDGGEGRGHVNRKRRRVEGSPLMEMPDLSQTQPSQSSSESPALGSPKSVDSTQIEDCDLPPSPVFPSSSAQLHVRIPKLDQGVLDSCSSSGLLLYTQESGISALSPHGQQPSHSPTFPKSPALCSKNSTSKAEETNSQVLHLSDDTQLSQEPHTSPVFGQTDCESALQADTVKATALTFSSQESSTSFCLEKDVKVNKSPVFSKTQVSSDRDDRSHSPVFGTNGRTVATCEEEFNEEDKETEEEQSFSQVEPSVDMTLHWSEEDEDNTPPVVSPSPVFPEENRVLQTENKDEESTPSDTPSRASAPQSEATVSEGPGVSGDSVPLSTVHYYWGVPFCPRGLDPGQYTKVIVAQMEVYEKSLKQAQRELLNKATWGEPILPQTEKCPSPESNSPRIALPTRRSRRLKGKLKELESEEEEVEVANRDSQESHSLWEEEHEEGDKEIQQDTEKEAREEEEEGQQKEPVMEAVLKDQRDDETQVESDCEVCPETQLSDDNTQELTLPSQLAVRSPDVEMIQVDSPNVPEPQPPPTPEPQESMEQGPESPEGPMEPTQLVLVKAGNIDLEGPHCETKSRESPPQSQLPDLDQNLDKNPASKEISGPDQVPDFGPDPVPGQDVVSGQEGPVQCPICSQVFPLDQIEMHAAFCDGEPAASEKTSPKPWRKRTRRGEAEGANHTDSECSGAQAQEKCYICQKAVPLRDYSHHTDQCLQRPPLRTATAGRLLPALDQSEPRESVAGPSGTTAQSQEVIDLVDDDEDSVSLIQISNSPIRSFTSISEAQDCLIDFSRQHLGKRLGTRQGTKPGTKHRSKRR